MTLPPKEVPVEWPFQPDEATFQAVFLQWAWDTEQQCTACHDLNGNQNGLSTPPLIVADSQLGQFEASREQVYATLLDSEFDSSERPLTGPLWRHSPEHENYENSYTYSAPQMNFLEDLMYSAWACQVPAHVERQDAGSMCGEPPPPPDAGVIADAGPDAGGADGGPPVDSGPPPSYPPCYCDEQPDAGMYDNSYCVVP